MALEPQPARTHEELASGDLRLEANVQVKVVRPILRSLGRDDAGSSHLRAEYPTANGRVDDAVLEGGALQAVQARLVHEAARGVRAMPTATVAPTTTAPPKTTYALTVTLFDEERFRVGGSPLTATTRRRSAD